MLGPNWTYDGDSSGLRAHHCVAREALAASAWVKPSHKVCIDTGLAYLGHGVKRRVWTKDLGLKTSVIIIADRCQETF